VDYGHRIALKIKLPLSSGSGASANARSREADGDRGVRILLNDIVEITAGFSDVDVAPAHVFASQKP
jgi:hypothetical protein